MPIAHPLRSPRSCFRRAGLALGAILAASAPASATWSILIADTRTGEVVLATSTCLTAFDMLSSTPVVLTGVGAATAQSAVEATGQTRSLIRDGLLNGTPPSQILTQLQLFDSAHQSRQYGIIDTRGGAATFSGRQDGPYAGGRTGRIGDLVYAVQGNVITGPCLIDNCVNAIANTPGSLGDKAMAAMEAAKASGGDGRCSCNADAADSCGCPPPNVETRKPSHIGVMIIARAGNPDACNAVYRTGSGPAGLAAADFTGDGKPDLIVTTTGASSTSLFRNTTQPGASLPSLASLSTVAAAATPRAVAVADFNGDGLPDLLIANAGSSNVSLVRGSAPSQFLGARGSFPVGSTPQAIAVADFDNANGLDAATANQVGNNVSLLRNDGAGNFTVSIAGALGVGALPVGLAAGDLDANGTIDLVVATSGRAALAVLSGNGDGTFTRLPDLAITGRPQAVAVRDFDHDGRLDIAVVTSAPSRITILYRQPAGDYLPVSLTPTATYSKLALGDFDGDGQTDLAALSGSALATVRTNGQRVPGVLAEYTLGIAGADLVAADFDADGADDLAISSPGINSAVLFKSRRGAFEPRAGCANGDYYFVENIPNQSVSDPDPVLQLRQRYDAFKLAQAGHVDAVVSGAVLDRNCLFADGLASARLRIAPRDLSGAPLPILPASVSVRHALGSARLAAIGQVALAGDGSLSVLLTSAGRTGVDKLQIDIVDPADGRTITLMPSLTLPLVPSPDIDRSGAVDPDDIMTFLACTFADPPCPAADFNADGRTDPDDIADFLAAYFGACP